MDCLWLINVCNILKDKARLIDEIRHDLPGSVVITTPNKGKDIGGKLALIDQYMRLKWNSDLMVFLHDKNSPHAIMGENWRASLFRIFDATEAVKIMRIFESHAHVGMVGAAEMLQNERTMDTHEYSSHNGPLLEELVSEYHLEPKAYLFIGGTMFWIRESIITDFFREHAPLNCRAALEEGNVMDHNEGTVTHAWERMFGLITSVRYEVKGI